VVGTPDAPFPEHASIRSARASAWRLAESRLPIYVTGETGTGRRTLAVALVVHRSAGRAVVEAGNGRPFPSERPAVMLVHHPVLLDTVEQVRLATWIAEGTRVVAWGSERFLADVHPELRPHVSSGIVPLPPLRARGADASDWAHYFARRHAGRAVPFDRGAEQAIRAHPWPGNLTELENAIVRGLALRDGDAPLLAGQLGLDVDVGSIEPLSAAVDRFRRAYIQRALERCGGNRTRAANCLGVDPRTVFRYLEDSRGR
jgi:DNA-binding NtrC family response regulator